MLQGDVAHFAGTIALHNKFQQKIKNFFFSHTIFQWCSMSAQERQHIVVLKIQCSCAGLHVVRNLQNGKCISISVNVQACWYADMFKQSL